jgi:hypothetical protein
MSMITEKEGSAQGWMLITDRRPIQSKNIASGSIPKGPFEDYLNAQFPV